MTIAHQSIKMVFLAAAIIACSAVECGRAHAAETRKAVFAGGCFWCVESDFEKVPGVIEAVSGFTGGKVANPSYKQVVSGGTGHIEAVEIEYNPAKVSYDELLHIFFRTVDPTDAGGQFCDRGHSYTTAIFVSNADERDAAEQAKREAKSDLGQDIVTPIRDAGAFYPASDYHQDYYKQRTKVLTRFGAIQKQKAYKRYRREDADVMPASGSFGGNNAPFANS